MTIDDYWLLLLFLSSTRSRVAVAVATAVVIPFKNGFNHHLDYAI